MRIGALLVGHQQKNVGLHAGTPSDSLGDGTIDLLAREMRNTSMRWDTLCGAERAAGRR